MSRGRGPAFALEPLLRVLERHHGAARAIKLKDLLLVLGLRGFADPGRAVRDAINALIVNGYPIGSISAEGPSGGVSGYFWIETEEELLECTAQLAGRVRELEKRIECVVSAYRNGPTQPMLFRGDAASTDAATPTPSAAPVNAPGEQRDEPRRFKPNFPAIYASLDGAMPRRRSERRGDGA